MQKLLFLLLACSTTLLAQAPPDSTHAVITVRYPAAYCDSAERQKLSGTVHLLLHFDEKGNFLSSDLQSGSPVLAACVAEALPKWKTAPYIHDGKPAQVRFPYRFDFLYKIPPQDAALPLEPGFESVIVGKFDPADHPFQSKVQPEYPQEAKQIRLHGSTKLLAVIATDGTIQGLYPLSGHPVLLQSSYQAVRQWRYKPIVFNGQAHEVQTIITVNYTLAGN